MDWAREQPDVSVWHTTASYRDSRFGMLWINDLLRRHGQKRWCIVVDPDEFLVYPMMETRSLKALAQFLEDDHRPCLQRCSSTPTATGRSRRRNSASRWAFSGHLALRYGSGPIDHVCRTGTGGNSRASAVDQYPVPRSTTSTVASSTRRSVPNDSRLA